MQVWGCFNPKEKGTYTEKMHQWPERRDSQITHENKRYYWCECHGCLTNYADMVRTAINEKIDVIFSGAGLPLDLPSYLTTGSITEISTYCIFFKSCQNNL